MQTAVDFIKVICFVELLHPCKGLFSYLLLLLKDLKRGGEEKRLLNKA